MIDFNNLQTMIDQKYIAVQKHPDADLYIYNYTQKTQFDRVWNNETLSCRGLILDGNKQIVARPFQKFFNLDEAVDQGEQLPLEDFVVVEKFDGSLGILYWINEEPYLATRGSFTSDQALKGTQILQNYAHYFNELNRDYTYLFEIIYPENRIVVDYGGMTDIILLAVIETKTGKELNIYEHCSGFPFAGFIDGVTDYMTLKSRQESNREGFVIKFQNGKRYKVKFDEYVRLHRLVTGVNTRTIWDLLRNNQSFDELMEQVPDEFYEWVKKTKFDLEYEYSVIETLCLRAFDMVRKLPTRKEQALEILKSQKQYSSVIFAILDNKPYEEIIWKMLKPSAEKPFKQEI